MGSDISGLMNEGAANFHKDVRMDFSMQDTILNVVREIKAKFGKNISLFYGLSVSVRYAVREAADLVEVAEAAELSIYNRISMTFDSKTMVSIYGTGKCVYIVSLPELSGLLSKAGFFAKYCTANMQYGRDGDNTVRVSVAISKDSDLLGRFITEYNACVDKSIQIEGIEKGRWKDLSELCMDMQEWKE